MKKLLIPLILILFLSFFVGLKTVKADTGYNLVDNFSFEDLNSGGFTYIDLPVNGFQNITDSWTEIGDFPYIGVFDNGATHIECTGESSQTINNFGFQNLPDNVASIYNITLKFNAKADGSLARIAFNIVTLNNYPLWIEIYDNLIGSDYANVSTNIYTYANTTSAINSLLLKVNRTTTGVYGGTAFVDAVCLHVGVELTGSGQTDITTTSSPWYVDTEAGFDGELTTDEAYEGTVSYKSVDSEYIGICQYFPNGFYGDNITEVSLYAKSGSASEVKVGISYAGYYTLTNTQPLTGDSSWHKITFELGYIVKSGRIIDGIEVNVISIDTIPTYIDNIVINSTVSVDFKAFEWSMTPTPKTISRESFTAYQNIKYSFTGYKYDFNGDLTENGTVSISSNLMTTQTKNLTVGMFNFDISERMGLGNIEERLDITITTDSGNFIISIFGTYLGDTSATPYEEEQTERTNNMINWLAMFMVIFLPALLLAGGIYENNQQPDSMHISPIFGIIAGLCLSIGIGVYTSLVPLWILILIIVAIAVLIVGMIKH